MKKMVVIIGLFATFLVLYFLQSNFFNWFTIAGIMPNLFIIFILLIGLFAGKNIGLALGIIFGLCLDFFIGKSLGIAAIMLGLIGLLGGFLDKNFSKESKITIILMVIGGTCVFEIGSYVFEIILSAVPIELWIFAKKLGIEILYNVLITIIFYPIFQKVGYRVEDIFKGNSILTRYF